MSAKFVLSTLGRMYLTDEGSENLSNIRIALISITALFSSLIAIKLIVNYFSISIKPITNSSKWTGKWAKRIFIVHLISYIIHGIHYADNIYRPVAYLEPRYLYQKYILTEMEITFFANFPISFAGLFGMKKLLTSLAKNDIKGLKRGCKILSVYIFGSLLTLGHYRVEFPNKFSPFVNFTIAGEGFFTIIFMILLIQCVRQVKFAENQSDIDLKENLINPDQGSKNKKSSSSTTGSIRSRTPIKSNV